MDFDGHERIDLHVHSTASDGTLSPAEILSLSAKLKLSAISITDHDTIEGSKEALALGIPHGLKFVSGIEISASPPHSFKISGSFHILGYSIDLEDPTLNKILEKLQQARKNRNPRIIRRLNEMGVDITVADILANTSGGQTGRPHIAMSLVKKGIVASINEAFDKYLAVGKPAYVDKYRISCAEAISIILGAGGIPVIAHPFLLKLENDKQLDLLLSTLKEKGLKGIEVYYPEHSRKLTQQYKRLAMHHNLLLTGGTDFHGSIKPEIQLGFGQGNFFVPYTLYERLVGS